MLTALASGGCDPETLEANAVDLKEEKGRRDRSGTILPGHPYSESVARQLAEHGVCRTKSEISSKHPDPASAQPWSGYGNAAGSPPPNTEHLPA